MDAPSLGRATTRLLPVGHEAGVHVGLKTMGFSSARGALSRVGEANTAAVTSYRPSILRNWFRNAVMPF